MQCSALTFNNRAKIVACEKVTLTFVDHIEHSASLALSTFENLQLMILKVYACAERHRHFSFLQTVHGSRGSLESVGYPRSKTEGYYGPEKQNRRATLKVKTAQTCRARALGTGNELKDKVLRRPVESPPIADIQEHLRLASDEATLEAMRLT